MLLSKYLYSAITFAKDLQEDTQWVLVILVQLQYKSNYIKATLEVYRISNTEEKPLFCIPSENKSIYCNYCYKKST